MASACLNTIRLTPEYSSHGWFRSRLSISNQNNAYPEKNLSDPQEVADPTDELQDVNEESDGFEFRLEHPVTMLPADELFSDGKLVPLQFSIRNEVATSIATSVSPDDPYMYSSPRAPRCSTRWRELLGFKKLYKSTTNNHNNSQRNNFTTGSAAKSISIRQLLYRNSKSANESSNYNTYNNFPLLNLAYSESTSVSSRPSHSSNSSSSGHEIDDHHSLPRLSLDSDKPLKPHFNSNTKLRMPKTRSLPTSTRVGRTATRLQNDSTFTANRGLSVDSPRINSSGKIVFHSLERSSSSPSSLTNGSRHKHGGIERSYSGNVRITPVLNVPVCSLRGMFSGGNNGGSNRSQRFKSQSTALA